MNLIPNTMNLEFKEIIEFIKSVYPNENPIPLHRPFFGGNEKKYLLECIDSTYVSSIGKYVDKFEQMICDYTGAKHAVATVNGTAALHSTLVSIGVNSACEVITQPLTFVATCNAISYCNAQPIFVDVSLDTLGMCPLSLEEFLKDHVEIKENNCINKKTGKIIKACIPMHTFGHPCEIDKIKELCDNYKIILIEDSAESIGSKYRGKHTGTFGKAGIYSFNGNKTVTCGGGGVIVTNDEKIAIILKHLTTTAKINHPYKYIHDEVGFNYRMPNINAALACAQLEQLDDFIESKRYIAEKYKTAFNKITNINFISEPQNSQSNYWLNSILFENKEKRDIFLEVSNSYGIMTRPIWRLMNRLNMYSSCFCSDLVNSEYLSDRVINIPSSVTLD